jgi:hypothetical protein
MFLKVATVTEPKRVVTFKALLGKTPEFVRAIQKAKPNRDSDLLSIHDPKSGLLTSPSSISIACLELQKLSLSKLPRISTLYTHGDL